MTEQKQAPERYEDWIDEFDWRRIESHPDGEWIKYADYEALAKQRDELAAKLKYHQHEVVDTHAANEADALARAEKAETERDKWIEASVRMQEKAKRLETERDEADKTSDEHLNARHIAEAERDQALAASAAREIAMRDRAAEIAYANCGVGYRHEVNDRIRALPLSPDGQQASDDVRANAWDKGYDQALKDDFGSKGYTQNPYRIQPSRSSDAGKSEDRG